jgi:hypothetical protein
MLELMWSLTEKSIRLWGLTLVMYSEEWRCTVRAYRIAARMRRLHLRIEGMRKLLEAGEACSNDDAILPDALQEMKDEIRELRWSMNRMQRLGDGQRLRSALLRAEQAAAATYLSADRLLWELQARRDAQAAQAPARASTERQEGCGAPQ